MTYSLICYRANGADYCKGCLMDTSDSAHDVVISESLEEIAKAWGAKLYENEIRERSVDDWEITLLVNGHSTSSLQDLGGEPDTTTFAVAEEAARVVLQRKRDEAEQARQKALEVARRSAAQRKRRAEEAKEEADLAEFARLSKKYGRSG